MIKNYCCCIEVIYLSYSNCIRYRSTQLVLIGYKVYAPCLIFTFLSDLYFPRLIFSKEKLNSDSVICRISFIIVLRARTLFSSLNYGFCNVGLTGRVNGLCRYSNQQRSTLFIDRIIFPSMIFYDAQRLSMR